MPIEDFSGTSFVAFTDICGFKEMMKHKGKAGNVLNYFYSESYYILRDFQRRVEGLFISDCGILFSRNNDVETAFTDILSVLKRLNRQMLRFEVMLTTSIAFGDFAYHQRLEFEGIEKNLTFGYAYLNAFLDNENGSPKISPGQCRVVSENLPETIKHQLDQLNDRRNMVYRTHLFKKEPRDDHYYFYWMVDDEAGITRFDEAYNSSYDLKYQGFLKALREGIHF